METKFSSTSSFKDLAISLAFTISQSPSPFTDTFITFNDVPCVKKFDRNDSIRYKLQKIAEGQNIGTDFHKTMDIVLKLLLEQKINEKIYLFFFSDMAFEEACSQSVAFDYNYIKEIFDRHNLQTPHIVFWNLSPKKYKNRDPEGVTCISGFNKEMLELFFKGDITGMRKFSNPSEILQRYKNFYPQI
jgi:hypothetical protein